MKKWLPIIICVFLSFNLLGQIMPLPFVDLQGNPMVAYHPFPLPNLFPKANDYRKAKLQKVEIEVSKYAQDDFLFPFVWHLDKQGNYLQVSNHKKLRDTIFGKSPGRPEVLYFHTQHPKSRRKTLSTKKQYAYSKNGLMEEVSIFESELHPDNYVPVQLKKLGWTNNQRLDSISIDYLRANNRVYKTINGFYSVTPHHTRFYYGNGIARKGVKEVEEKIGDDFLDRVFHLEDEKQTESFRKKEDSLFNYGAAADYNSFLKNEKRMDTLTQRETKFLQQRKIEFIEWRYNARNQPTYVGHFENQTLVYLLEVSYLKNGGIGQIMETDYRSGQRVITKYLFAYNQLNKVESLKISKKEYDIYTTLYVEGNTYEALYNLEYFNGFLDRIVRSDGISFKIRTRKYLF